MDLLDCTVMPYAWGSRTALAALAGRKTPSDGPEAELWMGAHPVAPSKATRDGAVNDLDRIIARNPERELGARTIKEFGPRLPFLLKVLAAGEPLSLQAHPTSAQAKAGWDDEEARGVPRDAPHRNYKDASHKPELLCALGPFDALSGFRAIGTTIELFDQLSQRRGSAPAPPSRPLPETRRVSGPSLGASALDHALVPLYATRDSAGLAETFRRLMTMPMEERGAVVDHVVAACSLPSPRFARERALAERLAKLYPGDIGVVSALLLELVHLEAGEAIYLGAGNLHAYLEGTGVEIMASSDNVLRGGLTKKHVDVPELIKCLDFAAGPAKVLRPREVDACESVYDTPAAEFRLSRITVSTPIARVPFGPEILLTTEGSVQAGDVEAPRGCSVFVPASTGRYTLGGDGVVFRATTNLE